MTLTITPGSDSGSFCAAPRALVQTLPQLINAQDTQRRRPIVGLSEALRQLHLLDEGILRELVAEDPDLLRSRSGDLVQRLLLTEDELHRALARVAGLVEIEVLGFEGDPKAFDRLPLRPCNAFSISSSTGSAARGVAGLRASQLR